MPNAKVLLKGSHRSASARPRLQRKKIAVGADCSVELLLSPSGEFAGFGRFEAHGVPLRNGARPLRVRLETPDGILYSQLQLREARQHSDGSISIRLHAMGLPWGRTEYMDEYDQTMVRSTLSPDTVTDSLEIILRPVGLVLGGRSWTGVSYQFHFQSRSREIHRLWTHETWEIGGTLKGNTLLHRGQCNRPVYRGSRKTLFTTACLKTLEQYGSWQGMSYQLGPRGGLIQAFDFLHAKQGALLAFWPEYRSLSSLVESPIGSDVLHVVDEYRFPLSHNAVTAEKWVLFTPGPFAEHEARDLWWDAHEHVHGGIRKAFGIERTLVQPEIATRYSTRADNARLQMSILGEFVDSTDALYALADRALPLMAKQGLRRFFPDVVSESDVTVNGMKRKLEAGIHGDLHCASVCATHRFFPSEFWGGIKAWKYLADKARSLGIELGSWFAPHFSPHSAIMRAHPDWFMAGINTLPIGGGYGHQTIVTADWHTDIYDWVLDDIRRWHDEGGLDFLFVDSWANLGLLEMNYRERMRTNLERLGRLFADLQKLGIRGFTFEGISPFGTSRFGMADLRGEPLEARGGIVGQNDFGWWVGEEDMAFDICLCVADRKRPADELERLQFRLAANRAPAMFDSQYGLDYQLPAWWARLNHMYRQALPDMKTRRLLPSGAGVRWENGQTQVIWAYRDHVIELGKRDSLEWLQAEGASEVPGNGKVVLQGGQVYRLRLA